MESVRQLFADLWARTMAARHRRLTLASEMEALNYEEVRTAKWAHVPGVRYAGGVGYAVKNLGRIPARRNA